MPQFIDVADSFDIVNVHIHVCIGIRMVTYFQTEKKIVFNTRLNYLIGFYLFVYRGICYNYLAHGWEKNTFLTKF